MRRRLGWAAVLLVLALVALLIGLLSGGGRSPRRALPPAAPPASTRAQFGANTGRLFNDGTYSAAAIDAQLTALHDTGATLARSDAFWEAAEPDAPSGGVHHYDWSFDDSIAGALAAHDLTWLPIIDYSTPWARSIAGQDHSAPSLGDYAAYAAAVAARYGPGGTFWQAHPQLPPHPVAAYEIWNEPDNPAFWVPRPDAVVYAELYLRARQAIDAVQPGARVIVGGLTHPTSFLPALMTAAPELRGALDGVAIHPYGATPQVVLDKVRAARATLSALGLGTLPLYVTEFGWTTSPPGALDYLSERLRPAYIEQTLSELGHTTCGVAAVLLYAWVTPERNPGDPEDWFGIHAPGAGPSPDTTAFTQGLGAASAAGSAPGGC